MRSESAREAGLRGDGDDDVESLESQQTQCEFTRFSPASFRGSRTIEGFAKRAKSSSGVTQVQSDQAGIQRDGLRLAGDMALPLQVPRINRVMSEIS